MSSMSFKRTSLLMSGGTGSGIGQKIDSIIRLAKEHKLSVIVDGPQQLGSFELKNADIVVMKDVKSVEDLDFNLSYYSYHASSSIKDGKRQFIVGTSLSFGELAPLNKLLDEHKFQIIDHSADPRAVWDDHEIDSWVAERFLIPVYQLSAVSANANADADEAKTAPMRSTTSSGLTSLILMGKNEESISKEINELVGNAADLGQHIPIVFVDASSHSNPLASDNVDNIGIVVCTNVAKLKDLHRLIRDYSTCRQFLIATTLSESEVRPLDGGGLHKFEYFNCSTSSFSAFQDDVVPEMIKEWKKYAAAAINNPSPKSSTSSSLSTLFLSTSTSTSTAPTVAVENKGEAPIATTAPAEPFINQRSLLISGPDGCGKSRKLKHLIALAKESRLQVKTVDASVLEFGNCVGPEVVMCTNVDTVDLLKRVIKHTDYPQLLLGTSLTEEELLPFKDELPNNFFDVYFFKAISPEERAKSMAIVAAGGLAPTICYDWAKEWASRDTASSFDEYHRVTQLAKGQAP